MRHYTSQWGAFDVLTTVFGPQPWFTDPKDWFGAWKILNDMGGGMFLFICAGILWLVALFFANRWSDLSDEVRRIEIENQSKTKTAAYS
jgi:hypothetical protein